MHPIAKNHERERLIVSIQDARHNLAYWIRLVHRRNRHDARNLLRNLSLS